MSDGFPQGAELPAAFNAAQVTAGGGAAPETLNWVAW